MTPQIIQYGHWQATTGPLAYREAEVTLHVTMGESNKVIAKKLGISPNTVKRTFRHAMYKLNTYGRAQTISEAIRTGIVSALLIIFALQNLTSLDNMMRTPRSRSNYSTRLNSGRNNSKNGDS